MGKKTAAPNSGGIGKGLGEEVEPGFFFLGDKKNGFIHSFIHSFVHSSRSCLAELCPFDRWKDGGDRKKASWSPGVKSTWLPSVLIRIELEKGPRRSSSPALEIPLISWEKMGCPISSLKSLSSDGVWGRVVRQRAEDNEVGIARPLRGVRPLLERLDYCDPLYVGLPLESIREEATACRRRWGGLSVYVGVLGSL